LITVADVKDLK